MKSRFCGTRTCIHLFALGCLILECAFGLSLGMIRPISVNAFPRRNVANTSNDAALKQSNEQTIYVKMRPHIHSERLARKWLQSFLHSVSAQSFFENNRIMLCKRQHFFNSGTDILVCERWRGLLAKTQTRMSVPLKPDFTGLSEPLSSVKCTLTENIHTFQLGNAVIARLQLPQNVSTQKVCDLLEKQSERVEYAESAQTLAPRQIQTPTHVTDPLAAQQYHLDRIQIREAWTAAWNQASGSSARQPDSSMVIAVVDTGVDWEHEDLAANVWTNPAESGMDASGRDKRFNGIDDDRNGKIDDWHGWDFVGSISEDEREAGLFREDNDPKPRINTALDPAEQLQHGTHVASTLAALMNNGKGGVGIAPRCRILPIKCSTDGSRVGGISRPYEAVLYAAQMGAKIIVCSFGGGVFSRFEQDVIRTANSMGALVVAAAGNDAQVSDNADFPASYDKVLCVGASLQNDIAASYSNYGLKVHVFAPGDRITSAIIGNKYSNEWSGTSMAVPIVAGVAALVRLQNPAWSPEAVIQQIRASSDNVLTNQRTTRPLGYFGRINALKALTTRPPGLTVAETSISAAGGVMNDAVPTQVRIRCRNLLQVAQNVRLLLVSLDNRASIVGEMQTLGNIANNDEKTAQFTIQLEPSAFQGAAQTTQNGTVARTAEFALVMFADNQIGNENYSNYERISIPYSLRPQNGAQILASTQINFGTADVVNSTLSSLPSSLPTFTKTANLTLRNFGTESCTLLSMQLSGVNPSDFSAQMPASTLAAGATVQVPVQFRSQQALAGLRTARITTEVQSAQAGTQGNTSFGNTSFGNIQGGYDFSRERGQYREITDGNSLRATPTAPLDDIQTDVNLGFPFTINGIRYERVTVSSNGFCAFAPASTLVSQSTPVFSPLSTSLRANAYIAAFARDLVAAAPNASLSTKTEGTAPNRVCILQWQNMNAMQIPKRSARETDTALAVSMQLRFYENSNVIECVFGKCRASKFFDGECGIRGTEIKPSIALQGASIHDVHSRRVSEDISASWANSVESRSHEDKCEITPRLAPEEGTIFRWTPRLATSPRVRTAQAFLRQTELRVSVPALQMTSVLEQKIPQREVNDEYRISPNPARDEATVSFVAESSMTLTCSVKNSLGAEVWQERVTAHVGENSFVLPVRNFASGVYFVTMIKPLNAALHQRLQQRLVVVH